jgi:hypothetical protein
VNIMLSSDLFQFFDCRESLLFIASGQVDFCIVFKKGLVIRFRMQEECTLQVSHPIPVLPPVTQTTFPVRSGMSSAVHFGFPGKISLKNVQSVCMTIACRTSDV